MALDDDALLVPATGYYWFHPSTGQEPPADPDDPAADGYVNLGHTALEGPFAINSEGGEQTILGTWQNPQARSTTSPRVESFAFIVQQWTEYNYKLYYGANAIVHANGYVYAPKNPTETEGTLWVQILDGDDMVAFHAPRVSILRADNLSLEAGALGGFPVRATVLGSADDQRLYGLTPKTSTVTEVDGLTVTPDTANLAPEATEQLTAQALYADATSDDVSLSAQWGTSDEEIATVSDTGLVTGVAAGTATVTAVYRGHTATCAVTVA